MHRGVGRRNFARQREHQADGQLRDGDSICAGGVHHHDAAAGGGLGVDVVDTHAGAADDPQLGRFFHKGVVHLHGRTHNQRIGIGQGRGQAVGELVVGEDFPPWLSRKHLHGGRRHFLRQNNLHDFSPFFGSGVPVEAHALLLAQQVKHAQHRGMRFALAALVFHDGVGMHA